MRPRRSTVFIAAPAVLTACGGGDEPATTEIADVAASIATVDDAETPSTAAAPAAPIHGAVISLLDVGVGAYAIERASGASVAIPIADISFIDRDRQPLVVDDAAYTLGFTVLAEQSYSHDVGIIRIDLTAGTGEQLFTIGIDRETDDATESFGYELVAVVGAHAFVERTPFGGGAVETSLLQYDLGTGSLVRDHGVLAFDETSDAGTCAGDVRNLVGGDGALFGTVAGAPVEIDPATGAIAPLVHPCSDDSFALDRLVDPADAATAMVTSNGAVPTPDQAADVLDFAEPDAFELVVADGALWWMFVHSSTLVDDGGTSVGVIFGGVARYDLARADITIFPIGDAAGRFVDPDAADGFTIETFQGELTVVDGIVWAIDTSADGVLLRLDPTTGEVTTTPIPLGDGPDGLAADTTRAELLSTDPDGLWLRVDRGVTSTTDDGGTVTSSVGYIDQLDPMTGEITRSIPESAITGIPGF